MEGGEAAGGPEVTPARLSRGSCQKKVEKFVLGSGWAPPSFFHPTLLVGGLGAGGWGAVLS